MHKKTEMPPKLTKVVSQSFIEIVKYHALINDHNFTLDTLHLR